MGSGTGWRRTARWLVAALAGVAGCRAAPRDLPPPVAPPQATTSPASATRTVPEPTLPERGEGPFAPSLARVQGHAEGRHLADVDQCEQCHADVASQWQKSAHAFASFNNPVYRVVVERFRKDRGEETSRFCGGCHDPSLLVDGAMIGTVEPTDLRAHAGVTCMTCHSIAEARPDGNGSWDLDTSPVPIPKDGDPDSVLRHRARVGRATLRTAALCATCHKAFLDETTGNQHHLVGQDDATPWARSAFAGSDAVRIDEALPEKDCRGCHMPRTPAVQGDSGAKNGTVASHFFLGGHTWLAAMQSDPAAVDRARAFLKDRVSIDVGGVRHQGGGRDLVASAPVAIVPGERAVLDVVLRNLDVGHRFPGGVMDAQDTWTEVVVVDAKGRRVAEAGTEQADSGADPTAHSLSSYVAREDGTQLRVRETHEFRAGVYNHTIEPRDAAVVGFAFVAPRAGYPLTVKARLRHRSRNLELQRAACGDTRSARGRAFGVAGLKKVARAIDACKPQPITDLAEVTVVLSGPGAEVPARADEPREVAFARRYAYGLGLSHALQEKLDDARAPLAAAFQIASTPRERAIALGTLALVASRQGRTDETFALAARADVAAHEAGMEPPLATQRARAQVLVSTWRLADAAPLLLDVASRSPRDDGAWSAAAVTLGGAGDAFAALDAAKRGLSIQPRDGDMLRVQALALTSLHAPSATADAAFLERRTPDDAPAVRARCSATVPGCAVERVPVHVHEMRQK
jgi:hypothetical protein